MQELFWQNNHYSYVHEGVRVHLAALLDMHCYCAVRLQEICMAKYKVSFGNQKNEAIYLILTTSNRIFFTWLDGKTGNRKLRFPLREISLKACKTL